jgi:hypothetical protein
MVLIQEMLKKKNNLTFEDIEDKLELTHDDFMEIILSMQKDGLIAINSSEESVSLIM